MSTNRQFVNIEGKRTWIPKVGFIIAVAVLVLAILILLHSRSKNAVSPIEIFLGTPQGPSSDVKVFSQDGVTVYMPPGATELDGTIAIATAQPNLSLLANDTGWLTPKVVNVEFRSLDGTPIRDIAFSEPLVICFDFTEEQWQGFSQNPEAYRIQYYAAQKSLPAWETLPLVTYPDRFQLCGQTYKLSLFGLSIQAEPGIPVTGFTTSMPPAAALPSIQTNERREGNNSNNASVSQVIPTNPPPTNMPSTQVQPTQPPPTNPPPTNPPPTQLPPANPPIAQPPVIQPPVIQPPATDPPRVEPPANEEQNRAEQEAREAQRRAEQEAREEQRRAEQQAREEERRAEQEAREEEKEKDKKQPDPNGSLLSPSGVFPASFNG